MIVLFTQAGHFQTVDPAVEHRGKQLLAIQLSRRA